MEDKKRKFQGQQYGSNYRFRANPQQAQPQQRYQGQSGLNRNQQPQRAQQQQQYKAPAQRQQQPNNVPMRNNAPNAPQRNGAPKAPNAVNDNKCFNYGEPGHYSNRCPKRTANTQHNYVQGKVNHVTAEIAQEAPDVVIGTFPVNSNSATVLFDSSASHSFIAYTFIKKHGIPVNVMKKHMLVSSPRGEMKAEWICLVASLSIRGG